MASEAEAALKNRSRPMLLAVLLVVIALAAAGLYIFFDQLANRRGNTVNTGAAIVDESAVFTGGMPIDPPRELKDFTLTSHRNTPIRLSDLRGQVALIYFGYTHCPDFCPITMGDFKQVKNALGADADRVAFVLISIDGARDTPEVLDAYLKNFDETFIGMTGSEGEIARIGADYELYAEKHAGSSAEEYVLDHQSSMFMIDQEGRLTMVYMHGTEPEVIVEDLRRLLG